MNPFLESIFVTIPETTFPSKFGNEAFDSRIRFSRKVSFSSFFPNLVGVVVLVVAVDGFDEDDGDAGEDEESKRVKKMSFLLCPPPLRRSLWMSLEEDKDIMCYVIVIIIIVMLFL